MADTYVQIPPDSSGKKVDAASLDVGVNTVLRQRVVIADNSDSSAFGTVLQSNPGGTEGGLVVRNIPSGTQSIDGKVAISGTAIVAGSVAISGTANVAIATAINIDHISATVSIAGRISISSTVATGISYVLESGTNSQVKVGDSANAAIRVSIVAGAGTGGQAQTDGTSFNAQSSGFNPIGGIYDDVASNTLSENDAGVARITTHRALHAHLRTDGGTAMDDSSNSALRVSIVAGGGTGGTSQQDGTSFNSQASNFNPIGGYYDDVSPDVLAENDGGAARITNYRAFHVNLRDSNGNEISAGAPLSVKIENVSATASVILAAGANNIGSINNISRTVTVVGVVALTTGTSNIGDLNSISRTVQVAVGTPFTINNISATVAVSGTVSLGAGTANIGSINGISATIAAVLAAGSANIGTINAISATVTVAVSGYTPPSVAVMSSSHGPKCLTASTSSNVTLIASPGAGASVYVTQLLVGNFSSTLTKARIGTSASASTVIQPCAASGGGFVLNFDPPWMLSASEACICSVKPNASDVFFTVNFFVR